MDTISDKKGKLTHGDPEEEEQKMTESPKPGDMVDTKYGAGMVTECNAVAMCLDFNDCAASILKTEIERKSGRHCVLREIEASDLDRVYKLEVASYPSDEAASREKLYYRFIFAKTYFAVIVVDGRVIGFVCGTKAKDTVLTEETMSVHEEEGKHLMIHSVVIDGEHRKKGYGLQMVREYVGRQREGNNNALQSIRLVCKQHLIPFYEKSGFELKGKSDLEHGQDAWYDMVLEFTESV